MKIGESAFVISIETLDDRYFPVRKQRGLQPLCIPIRCRSQRFELKPQCFIKLAFVMSICTQSLNRSRSVAHRRIVSHCFEQRFGFISQALTVDGESVIVQTYLPRSIYGQVHQHPAYLLKSTQIPQGIGFLCKMNQCISEFEKCFLRIDGLSQMAQNDMLN